MKICKLLTLGAVGLTVLTSPVMAQDDEAEGPAPTWEVDGEVAAFSDYRFRGISLSSKNPELTVDFSLSHESGFYAGVWGSNVELGEGQTELEVDLYAGFAKDLSGLSFDVGALYYAYPGNAEFDYVELVSSVGTTVGPAEVTVGVAYAPSQGALDHDDNTYVYISGDVPIGETPFSIHGTFGLENGAFADNKKDWLAGVSMDIGSGITATLDYVDSARSFSSAGDPTAVLSVALAL
jgi:uncharacterized protein (TIGR02001 family)